MVKIIFMGSDPIALPLLECLFSKEIEITAIYTQPDRRSGRGKKIQINAIKEWGISKGIEIRQPEKPGIEEVEYIKNSNVDVNIVMAYGHILKRSILDAPRFGTYNFHASLLPKLRGASPIETAIATVGSETGVTLMKIIPRMDAGPIVDSEIVFIKDSDTGLSLRSKLADSCVPLIERSFDKLISEGIILNEQVEAEATYCRRLVKEDGSLDFSMSAVELFKRIQAFSYWPRCSFLYEDQVIKVGLAQYAASVLDETVSVGTVISIDSSGVSVVTGQGVLVLTELQRPGGKMLPVSDFLRGFSILEGSVLASALVEPLVK